MQSYDADASDYLHGIVRAWVLAWAAPFALPAVLVNFRVRMVRCGLTCATDCTDSEMAAGDSQQQHGGDDDDGGTQVK